MNLDYLIYVLCRFTPKGDLLCFSLRFYLESAEDCDSKLTEPLNHAFRPRPLCCAALILTQANPGEA